MACACATAVCLIISTFKTRIYARTSLSVLFGAQTRRWYSQWLIVRMNSRRVDRKRCTIRSSFVLWALFLFTVSAGLVSSAAHAADGSPTPAALATAALLLPSSELVPLVYS